MDHHDPWTEERLYRLILASSGGLLPLTYSCMPIARNDPDFFEPSIIQTSHFFLKRFIRFDFLQTVHRNARRMRIYEQNNVASVWIFF